MRLLSKLESVDRGHTNMNLEMPTRMTAGGASTIAQSRQPCGELKWGNRVSVPISKANNPCCIGVSRTMHSRAVRRGPKNPVHTALAEDTINCYAGRSAAKSSTR